MPAILRLRRARYLGARGAEGGCDDCKAEAARPDARGPRAAWDEPKHDHDLREARPAIRRALGPFALRDGVDEIRAFLLHLIQERKVRPRTFNVYAGALKFLYEVTLGKADAIARMPGMRVPMHVPVVLTAGEGSVCSEL